MKRKQVLLLIVFNCIIYMLVNVVQAQDDLLNELESEIPKNQKVIATFKNRRVVNAQSCETVKKKVLDFNITHRFSNIVEQTGGAGGFHQFYGFDVSRDIRFSLDYGISNRIQLGIGRSKQFENIDGTVKLKILEQTENFQVPLTLVWYSNAAFTPMNESDFYANTDSSWVAMNKNIAHRIIYTHQLILASKFGSRFSFEILPTLNYRNLIFPYINPTNGAVENNFLYAVGFAGRIKLTKRFSLVGDYFYVISKFRKKNTQMPYYNPLGIGIEIETGGHVFTINCNNSYSIIENSYLPYSNDSWSTGAIKLGFNISRVFSFNKKG